MKLQSHSNHSIFGSTLKLNLPNFPLFYCKKILPLWTTIKSTNKLFVSFFVLVAYVSTINITARFVNLVCFLTNLKINTISKYRTPTKRRIKIVITTMSHSIIFILKNELLIVTERKQKRFSLLVPHPTVLSEFPGNRCITSNFLAKLSLTNCQSTRYVITFQTKFSNIKGVF